MIKRANVESIDSLFARLKYVQWPLSFCHSSWVDFIFESDMSILAINAQKFNVRLPVVQQQINKLYCCTPSLLDIQGPCGFLLELDEKSLKNLCLHFGAYLSSQNTQENYFNYQEDVKNFIKKNNEFYLSKGAIYKNLIAGSLHDLLKILNITFGAELQHINIKALTTIGFFCLKYFIQDSVSKEFIQALSFKLDVSMSFKNPAIYVEKYRGSRSKKNISLLLKYLVQEKQNTWS